MLELHEGGGPADGSGELGLQQSAEVEAASGGEPATIHGGGFQKDELVVMTIHLHHATAKKDVENPSKSIKVFWDLVAGYIIEFAVRLMTGDFNMALWLAVVELRARGFQANLAAWYPWKKSGEAKIRMDSCAIIVIGPVAGGKRLYDPSVLCEDVQAIELPETWKNV